MDRGVNPPFPVGQFVDSIGEHLLGQEWEVEDTIRGTNEKRRIRLVKNSSGGALLPGRLAKMKAGSFWREISGCTTVDAEDCFPIDELLPASGVPDQSYFYVITGGPALALTTLAPGVRSSIAEGDMLVCTAGATTGATSAGRIQLQNVQAATANATAGEENAEQIQRAIGRAASARTTNETNSSILVYVTRKW